MSVVCDPDVDALQHAAVRVARHHHLDRAATVMVGAVALARLHHRCSAVPSAEERAELLALAGDADHFERFIEAATSRAWQFVESRWQAIERLAR